MNEFIQQLREQLNRVWGQLNAQQKVLLLAAPAVLLVTLAVAVYIAGQPQMVNLVSSSDTAQLGQIRRFLDTQNIPYELPDPNTILVDRSVLPRAQMELAIEGLVGYDSGPGFELFDQTRFGMTDRMFDLNERRALQSTLSQALVRGNNRISEANVILEIPEESLFQRDQAEPSASVKIIARGSLPQESVEGIQRFIAASVAKLSPENVVVMDQNNKLLSADSELEPGVQKVYKQMQVQQAIEDKTRRDVVAFLEKKVGPGNYEVTVNARLDWEKRTMEKTQIDAENPAPASTKLYDEKTETRGIAGPPGVTANVQDTGIGPDGDISTTQITEEITNNQYSWWRTMIDEEQGEVREIAVGVMVNHHENEEGEMIAWTPEELTELERLLRVAAGLNPQPNPAEPHKFEVQSHRFDTSFQDQMARDQMIASIMSIVRSIIPLLLLFALGYFAYVFFQRAFAPPEAEEEGDEEIPIEPVSEAKELTLSQLGLAEFGDIASLPAEEQRRIKMQEHVINYAAEKPEEVASIIKAWLSS